MIKGAPDGSEQATITELAERLQLAQNTVTELVARAEAAGLLARERSGTDGRVVRLRLTEEGERRLAATVAALREDRRRLVHLAAGQRARRRPSPSTDPRIGGNVGPRLTSS